MGKFKTLLLSAAACTLLGSCANDNGKSLDQIAGNSDIDSMMYYFGELRAADYWQAAAYDSTMLDEKNRQQYLEGLKDGLNTVHDHEDYYNRGLKMGMQMALTLQRVEKNYNVKVNQEVAYEGFAYGLTNDSIVDETYAQNQFYRILQKYREEAESNNRVLGEKHLREEASSLKMRLINKQLWGKTITEGTTSLTKGEKIKVDIHLISLKGRDIDIPFPQDLEVGNHFLNPMISNAINTMKKGGKSQFATTTEALIGTRYEQLRLEPSEVILFTISIL